MPCTGRFCIGTHNKAYTCGVVPLLKPLFNGFKPVHRQCPEAIPQREREEDNDAYEDASAGLFTHKATSLKNRKRRIAS